MHVNLRCESTDEACWNMSVIRDYVDDVNRYEDSVTSNPDIKVIPGEIACSGCVEKPDGNGTICSARLTETRVGMTGEPLPGRQVVLVRASQIPGFKMVKPGSGKWAEGYVRSFSDTSRQSVEQSQFATVRLKQLFKR